MRGFTKARNVELFVFASLQFSLWRGAQRQATGFCLLSYGTEATMHQEPGRASGRRPGERLADDPCYASRIDSYDMSFAAGRVTPCHAVAGGPRCIRTKEADIL